MAQTQVKVYDTFAVPHIPGLEASLLIPKKRGAFDPEVFTQVGTRLGALVWWRFQDSWADFTDLAEAARKAGLPSLFAPLPHPTSPTVAFNRMTRAAERVIGDEQWHGTKVDRVSRQGSRIPAKVRTWCNQFKPPALVEAIQTWEPDRSAPESVDAKAEPSPLRRPFHVRLWICLRQDPKKSLAEELPLPNVMETPPIAPDTRRMPTMEVARFFMVVETDPVQGVEEILDITDHVVNAARSPEKRQAEQKALVAEVLKMLGLIPSGPPWPTAVLRVPANLKMGAHLYTVLDRQRTRATSPEIGDGVNEALEDVAGIKLMPGLFVVPGNPGIERSEALLAYLEAVPHCDCGMFNLYATEGAPQLAGLMQPALEDDIERLERELRGLYAKNAGARALRSSWLRIAAQRWRLQRNRELLGPVTDRLEGRLKELAGNLEERAGDVDLAAKPSRAAGKKLPGLQKVFEAIEAFARGERVKKGSPLVTKALARSMGPLQSLRCKMLQRRLRKLVLATIHVSWDRSHGNEADARARIERLRPVLADAAGYLEEQCR